MDPISLLLGVVKNIVVSEMNTAVAEQVEEIVENMNPEAKAVMDAVVDGDGSQGFSNLADFLRG
jgi:hypothetical protein|tara:strand:+ start:2623 stop:2814 length:192 start_codon:yes stop_codon:yes gene_type:complete